MIRCWTVQELVHAVAPALRPFRHPHRTIRHALHHYGHIPHHAVRPLYRTVWVCVTVAAAPFVAPPVWGWFAPPSPGLAGGGFVGPGGFGGGFGQASAPHGVNVVGEAREAVPAHAIPEPGSLLVFAAAAVAVIAIKGRRS